MQSLSTDEIRASFVNCSKGEAKRMPMPSSFDAIRWDDLDFLGWRDLASPRNAYLVAPWREQVVGVVLRISTTAGLGGRKNMCTVCFTTHSSSDMALMVAPKAGAAGRNGNTVGTYLCGDLACSLYVRGLKRPARVQPEETTTPDQRVARLREHLDAFVRRVVDPR